MNKSMLLYCHKCKTPKRYIQKAHCKICSVCSIVLKEKIGDK